MVWDPAPARRRARARRNGGDPRPPRRRALRAAARRGGAARAGAGRGLADALDDAAARLRGAAQARAVVATERRDQRGRRARRARPLVTPAPNASAGDPCGAGEPVGAGAWRTRWPAARVDHGGRRRHRGRRRRLARAGGLALRRPVDRSRRRRPSAPRASATSASCAAGAAAPWPDSEHLLRRAAHAATSPASRRPAGSASVASFLLRLRRRRAALKGPPRPMHAANGPRPRAPRARVRRRIDDLRRGQPHAALERLRPDVWAKGGDYAAATLPEASLVRSWGGRVVLLPYLPRRPRAGVPSSAPRRHPQRRHGPARRESVMTVPDFRSIDGSPLGGPVLVDRQVERPRCGRRRRRFREARGPRPSSSTGRRGEASAGRRRVASRSTSPPGHRRRRGRAGRAWLRPPCAAARSPARPTPAAADDVPFDAWNHGSPSTSSGPQGG